MSYKDYEVGHGRPPKHTQFKKGQSGNPKGRRKGARGLKTDLRAELNERVEVKEQGKVVRMTKQRLMLKQLVAKAIKGNDRAGTKVADLAMVLLGPDDEVREPTNELPADDDAILDAYLTRRMEQNDDQ